MARAPGNWLRNVMLGLGDGAAVSAAVLGCVDVLDRGLIFALLMCYSEKHSAGVS